MVLKSNDFEMTFNHKFCDRIPVSSFSYFEQLIGEKKEWGPSLLPLVSLLQRNWPTTIGFKYRKLVFFFPLFAPFREAVLLLKISGKKKKISVIFFFWDFSTVNMYCFIGKMINYLRLKKLEYIKYRSISVYIHLYSL